MRTSIGLSGMNKRGLDDIKRRRFISSYNKCVEYLIQLEKELELDKLTKTVGSEEIREILREELGKAMMR